MSIVETLQRPADTNGSAKTYRPAAKRGLKDTDAKERPNRAETTASVSELQEQRDFAIAEKAKAVLHASAYHPIRLVSSEVRNCTIILRGRVPSFYMKQIAQTVVRHLLEGSLVIDNQLEVDRT